MRSSGRSRAQPASDAAVQGNEDLDFAAPLIHLPEQDSKKHEEVDHESDRVALPCCKEL